IAAAGQYGPRARRTLMDSLGHLVLMALVAMMGVVTVLSLATDDEGLSRALVGSWVWTMLGLGAVRVVSTLISGLFAGETARGQRTLIIGAGDVGRRVAVRLLAQSGREWHPIGFLDEAEACEAEPSPPLPLLGSSEDLERIV